MFSIFRLSAALALVTIAVVGVATPAQAHTAAGGASCSGAVLDAVGYDDALANTYSITVDQDTSTGTFGASVQRAVPVPQDGAVHSWSYSVEAEDGSFHFADSGQVGPCGSPPIVDVCPELSGDQPVGSACTPPPAQVVKTHTTALDCDAREQVTTTTTTTTPFVFDQATQRWVAGTPVQVQELSSEPTTPRDCTEPPVDVCPDVDGVQTDGNACDEGDSSQPPTDVPETVVFEGPPSTDLVLPAAGALDQRDSLDSGPRLAGMGALGGGVMLLAGLAFMRRQALTA